MEGLIFMFYILKKDIKNMCVKYLFNNCLIEYVLYKNNINYFIDKKIFIRNSFFNIDVIKL